MSNPKYISLDRIFAKLSRDLPIDSINESDVVEWAGEALEAIGAVSMYEQAVAFVEVKNHQCAMPSGMHSIIQIARNHCFSAECITEYKFCPATVASEVVTEEVVGLNPCTCVENPCSCNGPKVDYTLLDCNGTPITGYDIAYYRPYFDLQYEYYNWNRSSLYGSCYAPVRLSNNTFMNSVVLDVCTQDPLYAQAEDEYTIVNGDTLRFSFCDGSVAIAYLRQVLDPETGYPMIPDEFSYVTAITKYITLRMMERDFYANREGSQSRVQKAESDWHWYCKQASNLAMMPKGIDQWQNILEQRYQLLPKLRNYYNFFGNMSKFENRKWNHPNGLGNITRGYH